MDFANRVKKKGGRSSLGNINKIHVWLIFLFFLYLLLFFIDQTLLWDENAYLGNAREVLGHSAYSEDFRSPLLSYIIAAVWFFSGESLVISKIVVTLFSVASVFLFFLISERYVEHKKSLLLTVFFSLSSLVLFWGFRIYADMITLFFILLSFYFVLNENSTGSRGFILAGVFAALAFLSRFPSGLFLLAILLHLLIRRKFKGFGVVLLSAIIVVLPWLVLNASVFGDPLYNLMAQWNIVELYTSPEPLEKFVTNFLVVMHFLVVFIPFGIYSLVKKRADGWTLIFIYLILFIVYCGFFVNLKLIRYFIMALPFFFILVGEGMQWMERRHKQGKIFTVVALIAVIIAAGFTISFITNRGMCENNGATVQSTEYICSHTQEGDVVLSNNWPYFGYACNVSVGALWASVPELLDHYHPTYIVYVDKFGLAYDTSQFDEHLSLEKTIEGYCGETVSIYTP